MAMLVARSASRPSWSDCRSRAEDMLKEDGKAEVVCHFCNVAYTITGERLEQMIVAKTPADVN